MSQQKGHESSFVIFTTLKSGFIASQDRICESVDTVSAKRGQDVLERLQCRGGVCCVLMCVCVVDGVWYDVAVCGVV